MTNTLALPRNKRILEARTTFQKALDGDLRARADLAENLTRSDFPILLGAAYGRELLQEYSAAPAVWQAYASRRTVADFREHNLVDLIGGRAGLQKVGEAAEYPAGALTEAKYAFRVDKYGARIPLTWEMLINDDLGAFNDLPSRLATAARETEDKNAASVLFNAAGTAINGTFFSAANGNGPTTLPLTADNLEAALLAVTTRKDSDGRPVTLNAGVLMVPPALEVTARRILNATEVRRVDGDTTTVEPNTLAGRLALVVNPWLTIVNTGAAAATTWFLLPAPSTGRPAIVSAFLRGHESPDLRMKSDAGNRVGGGALPGEEGSFDDDTIQYRVRHVHGAGLVIPAETYASTGAG